MKLGHHWTFQQNIVPKQIHPSLSQLSDMECPGVVVSVPWITLESALGSGLRYQIITVFGQN